VIGAPFFKFVFYTFPQKSFFLKFFFSQMAVCQLPSFFSAVATAEQGEVAEGPHIPGDLQSYKESPVELVTRLQKFSTEVHLA
jgi:hypothetical protein